MSQRSSKIRDGQTYAWLGAGALTLGLGAALVGGAGAASADTGAGSAGKAASAESGSTAKSAKATSKGHSAHAGGPGRGTPKRAGESATPAPAAATTAARAARIKTTAAEATAAAPNPAADPSFSMTSWLPDTPIQPGTSVAVALQQISDAQDLLKEQTWGSGNVFAGMASIVPLMLLSGAESSLTNWQTSTPSAQQAVADTVGTPLVHQAAQMQLMNALLQPTIARFELSGAALLIPMVGVFGASDAAAQTTQLVSSAKQNGRVYGVVPLHVIGGTEQVVYISVNGGQRVPVLVDTGSSGLVLSPSAVGSGLGPATGSGTSAYSGGLTYDYTTYDATVDFGNGITTTPTSVNVVNSDDASAFTNYFAPAGVVGVLGVGANAVGPGPSHPATSLPGELSDGILIYQGLGVMVFGPNPLPVRVSVPGVPNANLQIQVGDGDKLPVNAIIDSGGVYGTIPDYLIGGSQNIPAGTLVSVYTNDGQTLLYSYTTGPAKNPTVISDTLHNTGNEPFRQGPIYLDYSPDNGIGSTNFDYV